MVLLISLLICHYLADFCFAAPAMIRAKADGRNPWPILLHASVHALLIGLCLLIWHVAWDTWLLLMLVELISHFLIDTGKGLLTSYYPLLADQQKKPYWMLYGFDQLLHLLICRPHQSHITIGQPTPARLRIIVQPSGAEHAYLQTSEVLEVVC